MAKERTLEDLLRAINVNQDDVDVYVDGIDGMAVCYPVTLTEEGRKKWGDVLKMKVDGHCIMGTDEDYDALDDYECGDRKDAGKLGKAWDFICSLAGYCPSSKYDKWFEGGEEI